MKLPKQLPENSLIKQKRDIAIQLSIVTSMAPQMYRLLEIDKMCALRLFVILRNEIFLLVKPFIQNGKKHFKYVQSLNDHNIISNANLRLSEYEKLITRKPNDEERFSEVVNSMLNLVILYFIENFIDLSMQPKFATEYLKLIEKFELVFGRFENENLLAFIEKLSKQKEPDDNLKIAPDIVSDGSNQDFDKSERPMAKLNEAIEIEGANKKLETDDVFMSREDVANFYNISLSTLWRWEKKGSIPKAIRIGGSVMWKKFVILKHLEDNTNS